MRTPLALATLLATAACADEQTESDLPTAPSASVSSAHDAAPPAAVGATVCLSYGRERERARAELDAAPRDAALQQKLKSLDDLILDAC